MRTQVLPERGTAGGTIIPLSGEVERGWGPLLQSIARGEGEMASLSPRLSVEVYNFQIDKEKVRTYGIDKLPATAIVGKKDLGVRYYGIPSDYEFSSLIGDVLDVSSGNSGLGQATRDALKTITQPVHIRVFTTST